MESLIMRNFNLALKIDSLIVQIDSDSYDFIYSIIDGGYKSSLNAMNYTTSLTNIESFDINEFKIKLAKDHKELITIFKKYSKWQMD